MELGGRPEEISPRSATEEFPGVQEADEWDRFAGSRGAPVDSEESAEPGVPVEPAKPSEPEDTALPAPVTPVRDDRMADPGERGAFVDSFVESFAGSATWRAMLAVGDVLFPGFGSYAKVMRWTDDVGFPVRVSEPGLGLDLSVSVSEHRTLPRFTASFTSRTSGNGGDAWAPYPAGSRPPVLRPYDGALVIDTLDPRRYHRAVSGPLSPRDISGGPAADRQARHGEDEETTGVVIVSHLAAAGKRLVDADALWRQALTVITETLYDPRRPTPDARQVVRALRYVVFLDPALGLGLCLSVDEARLPWCPLLLTIDQSSVRFLRA